jgi:antirestriction protein ArdC
MDFPSPYYLTFLQCKEKGGTVLSGSKSQMVVYWKVMEYGTDDSIKKIPFIRYSNVFNISQTSLNSEEGNRTTLLECEKILSGLKDKPVIKNNINRCYYDPVGDYISLPTVSDFTDETEYWSSLFHELIHWSGREDRLKRIKTSGYSKEEYSFEELVAEIGGAYLCALCGISPKVVDNQISYIDGWMRLSKEEENLFPRAAAEASKAVSFILGDSAFC